MKNKFLVFSIFILFLLNLSFGENLVPQKIGISVDKNNENYSIDLILLQAVLSTAADIKNIYFFSGDKADLEVMGIKELNGSVLLKSVTKNEYYVVELYSIDQSPSLLDDSIKIQTNNFINSVGTASAQVVTIISNKYPPKQKKELKKIETVTIGLSEFEPLNPVWSVRVIPSINMDSVEVKYMFQPLTNQGSNDKGRKLAGSSVSADVDFLYHYRFYNASFGFSGNTGGNDFFSSYSFSGNAGGGIGLFGSLFVLGAQVYYQYWLLYPVGDVKTEVWDDQAQIKYYYTVPIPNIICQSFMLAMTMQLNITKDYYIFVSSALPFSLNSTTLEFRGSDYNAPEFSFNSFSGPPFLRLIFHWSVNKNWSVIANYSMLSKSFWSDTGGGGGGERRQKPILLKENSGVFLRDLNISQIRIGLGLEYEY